VHATYELIMRTREILVSVTFQSHSSLFVYFTFRPFSIAHEELQRTTKKHRAPFPNPLSFFVPLAGRIHRPSSGSTQIDDSTMTRWRNFHVVERHHNTCYSEILLRIRVLHVCDIIGVYYYFENSAEVD
jgi:hypothetical protein